MSLEQVHGFSPGQFDLIYCSNTLEHVPHVTRFLREAWRLLKPAGTLLLAVPPITDARLEYLNLINPYYVNIWTPRQRAHTLGLFFDEAQPVLHGVERLGADFRPEHFTPASTLTERSFVFAPCSLEEMYRTFTLTAVFLAKKPRPEGQVPAADALLTFVDQPYTRPEGRIDPVARQRLKRYLDLPAPPYFVPAGRQEKPGLKGIVDRSLAFVAKKLRR